MNGTGSMTFCCVCAAASTLACYWIMLVASKYFLRTWTFSVLLSYTSFPLLALLGVTEKKKKKRNCGASWVQIAWGHEQGKKHVTPSLTHTILVSCTKIKCTDAVRRMRVFWGGLISLLVCSCSGKFDLSGSTVVKERWPEANSHNISEGNGWQDWCWRSLEIPSR